LGNLGDLRKNGVDVLMLFFNQAYNGLIKDTNPGQLGEPVKLKYQTVSNGLSYLIESGILCWHGDDLIYPRAEKMFQRGQGGFFAVHNVFASENFIRNVNEIPKKLAIRLLSTGIGSRYHKRASKGLVFKTKTLMAWAGVDRFSRLAAALKDLEDYFIITYYKELDKFNIRVRPEYLTAKQVNKFHATLSGLYYLLKQNNYFIKDNKTQQDILGLMRRYGQKLVGYALEQARYVWENVSNLGGYLHTIILGLVSN